MRISRGCWTCRLRRKKCDGTHPICNICAGLSIRCYFNLNERPDWMDGGARQNAMLASIRSRRNGNAYPGRFSSQEMDSRDPATARRNRGADQNNHREHDEFIDIIYSENIVATDAQESAMFVFYIAQLLPFLYPFYAPSIAEGGKGWILQLLLRRPIFRQTIICQSTYFSRLWSSSEMDSILATTLSETQQAFATFSKAIQYVQDYVAESHLRGMIRLLTSIVQLYRFETFLQSNAAWTIHLTAAVSIMFDLLDTQSDGTSYATRYDSLNSHLKPPGQSTSSSFRSELSHVTCEQSALTFTSALLIFDDTLASTVLGEEPRLLKLHAELLMPTLGTTTARVDLSTVLGLDNMILMTIGQITKLEAWKCSISRPGPNRSELEAKVKPILWTLASIADSLPSRCNPVSRDDRFTLRCLSHRAWIHATYIYAYTVMLGWQSDDADMRHHVDQCIHILCNLEATEFLRIMTWPLCLAGCFASGSQQIALRALVADLPMMTSPNVHKALRIMTKFWTKSPSSRGDIMSFSMCCKTVGEQALFV